MFTLDKTTHHSDHPKDADWVACMSAVVGDIGGRARNIRKARSA
jgi:hypothetical protein